MKIPLRKVGEIMVPADEPSKILFSRLADGRYNCSVTKARLSGEAPDEIRRLSQNRLLHAWHEDQSKTCVNEFAGNTPEQWKDIMKFKFLVDMYLDLNIKGYAEVINPMMSDYTPLQMDLAKWGLIKRDWITTRDLSVENFKVYLDKIEKFCMQNGIMLRTDLALYKHAVG